MPESQEKCPYSGGHGASDRITSFIHPLCNAIGIVILRKRGWQRCRLEFRVQTTVPRCHQAPGTRHAHADLRQAQPSEQNPSIYQSHHPFQCLVCYLEQVDEL